MGGLEELATLNSRLTRELLGSVTMSVEKWTVFWGVRRAAHKTDGWTEGTVDYWGEAVCGSVGDKLYA